MEKILVIDDDQDLSDTIKSALQYEGYTVLISHNGTDGIKKAEEYKPDLILLDIMMPGMDGTEAISILKGKSVTKNIPVIFLTGLLSGNDDGEELDINAGGVYVKSIAKPFDNAKLLEVIKTVLT